MYLEFRNARATQSHFIPLKGQLRIIGLGELFDDCAVSFGYPIAWMYRARWLIPAEQGGVHPLRFDEVLIHEDTAP